MYIPSYSVIVTGCSFLSLSIISILPILLALAYSIAASSVGQVLPVLFETEEDGFCFGHSDTYLMVKVRASSLRRQIKDVRITNVEGDVLCGECI